MLSLAQLVVTSGFVIGEVRALGTLRPRQAAHADGCPQGGGRCPIRRTITASRPSKPLTEPVIIRIFSDAAGETHFGEIRLPGGTRRSEASASVAWWSEKVPVRSLVWRRVEKEAPPAIPHTSPRRQLIVPLSGAVEIEVSTGEQRTVVPGQVLMVDDVTGKGHITRAADDATRVTLVLELADEPVPGT